VQPFFSPDGQRVGFITGSRDLKTVSLTGEPPLTVADSVLTRSGGSWGTDGYLYVGWQQNRNVLSRIPAAGGEAEPVTTLNTVQGEMAHSWPDALPSGRGVLFTARRAAIEVNEDDDVAVVDLATGEHRALVRGIYGRYVPGYLIFVRYDGTLFAAPFDQDKLVLAGPPVPLLAGMSVQPGPDLALSQSGRLVYSTSGSATGVEVVWVDREGGTTTIEPGWTLTPSGESGPVLSPDGSRLAISVRGPDGVHLWIKEIGGPFQRLTFEGAGSTSFWGNARPTWTRNGQAVTFVSDRGENRDLYVKRADGSAGAEVLLDDVRTVDEGSYSPDGGWLVYRLGDTDGDRDLYAIRPGVDSVATPLVAATGFDETAAALSPDGQWLAYVSNESGRSEVYVRSFPNVAETKRQISIEGGAEPVWAHSGRELFYKNAARELVAATVRTDPSFAVVEREPLFTLPLGASYYAFHSQYDISQDDERFIMFRTPGAAEAANVSELVVVENFFEELKAKVGR
jgi:Tol biopolymer transport system component